MLFWINTCIVLCLKLLCVKMKIPLLKFQEKRFHENGLFFVFHSMGSKWQNETTNGPKGFIFIA